MSPRRIFFAFDGTPESVRGLEQIQGWARLQRHTVVLTHVVESPTFTRDELDPDLLAQAVDSLESDDLVVETRITTDEDVAEALTRVAKREGADLLVMNGTAGAVRSLFFGNVAEDVLALAECPVLILRGRGVFDPAGRVVLPVVLDGLDENAVQMVRVWASREALSVDAVHVEPVPVVAAAGLGEIPSASADPVFTEADVLEVIKALEDMSTELRPHVVRGRPGVEILRIAAEVDSNLIVMGTSGVRGLERVLLGSVAAYVLRRAECPVLIVPSGPDAARAARFRLPSEVVVAPIPLSDKRRILEDWKLDEMQLSESAGEGMAGAETRADRLREVEIALGELPDVD